MLRIAILSLFIISSAYSFDFTVSLEQVSSSGKTILINKGAVNDINVEDYGILLVKVKQHNKQSDTYYEVYKPVAKLKAVKVLTDNSIWVAFKTFIPTSITQGAKLLLLSESALLRGRTKLKINNMKAIVRKNEITQKMKETIVDDGNFLSRKKEDYYSEAKLKKKEVHTDKDVTLVDIDTWKEKSIPGELTFEGFYKSPHAEVFADRKRVHRFEKMVVQFMKKYNDPKFTMQDIYYAQRRNQSGDDTVQDTMIKDDFFSDYQHEMDEKRKRQEKFYDDLLTKGEGWSDDYSDEELSELLYNVGVINEKDRRSSISAQRYDYQLYGSFGLNLINNENLQDNQNTQQSKYDVEFSAEYYFLKKFENLRYFSFETSLRKSNDAFTTGTYNAVSTEYSGGLHLNWYPFITPNTMDKNIIYVGLTFRYGLMSAEIPSLGERGNYQVNTFPGFRGGIKYNFSNKFGLRMAFGLEKINIEREIRTFDSGELPDRESFTEGKLSLALSRFY